LIKAEEETVDRWLHVTWKIDDEPLLWFCKKVTMYQGVSLILKRWKK